MIDPPKLRKAQWQAKVDRATSPSRRLARYEKALREIAALDVRPFVFPSDWEDQVAACAECKRWESHPIQQGICDTHRQPLWAREKHDAFERAALGLRMAAIARKALEDK